MKYFFDTEFIEDGKTIELISIGIVNEDGQTYYAETPMANDLRLTGKFYNGHQFVSPDPWITANVVPHLKGATKQKGLIASDIINFCNRQSNWPEFWAYYASYDWVALCQLYGRMIDLPIGWPKWCRDLKQIIPPGVRLPKQPSGSHDALQDALWVKELHSMIMERRI